MWNEKYNRMLLQEIPTDFEVGGDWDPDPPVTDEQGFTYYSGENPTFKNKVRWTTSADQHGNTIRYTQYLRDGEWQWAADGYVVEYDWDAGWEYTIEEEIQDLQTKLEEEGVWEDVLSQWDPESEDYFPDPETMDDEAKEFYEDWKDEHGDEFGLWDMGEEETTTYWEDEDGNIIEDYYELSEEEREELGATEVATVSHAGTEELKELLGMMRDGNASEKNSAARLLAHQVMGKKGYWLADKETFSGGGAAWWRMFESIVDELTDPESGLDLLNEDYLIPSTEDINNLQDALKIRNDDIYDLEKQITDFQDDIDDYKLETIPGYYEDIGEPASAGDDGEWGTEDDTAATGLYADIAGKEEDIVGKEEDIGEREEDIETTTEDIRDIRKTDLPSIVAKKAGLRKAQKGLFAAAGQRFTPEAREYYEKYGEDLAGVEESVGGKLREIETKKENISGYRRDIRDYGKDIETYGTDISDFYGDIGTEGDPGPDMIFGTADDVEQPTGKYYDIYQAERGVEDLEQDITDIGYYDPLTGKGAGDIEDVYEGFAGYGDYWYTGEEGSLFDDWWKDVWTEAESRYTGAWESTFD